MTKLRKRFIDDMQLHGFSERTIEAYVRSVRQLAEHYDKSPDKISEEELRQYVCSCASRKRRQRSLYSATG